MKDLYQELARKLHGKHDAIRRLAGYRLEDVPRDLEKALEGRLVVLYFTASWCAPCVSFMETVREVAAKLRERVAFYKVDVDKNMSIANRYNVEYLPATLLLKGGEPVDRIYGIITARSLESRINRLLE
ncbi:MAG: thioredoxin family protein [Acidilobaceae archaeon]|nr:thioredoxin family protein [Acidilobaceae archaeon]MCX8165407.1 thioredoxin family protein [Acidilobaceae archaeon]MDW7973834.1 thioredoxin family protein [Sulfolobales archaeon]